MITLGVIIYLLVGFQVGARSFYWGHKIRYSLLNFIVPLILIPFLWPVMLILSIFIDSVREGIFRWDK